MNDAGEGKAKNEGGQGERAGWNYRVVREHFQLYGEPGEMYAIYEAYYNVGTPPDGDPESLTESSAWPSGDNVEQLRSDLEMMLHALGRPVIDQTEWQERHGVLNEDGGRARLARDLQKKALRPESQP